MRLVAVLIAITMCGPETTSFRTTDRGDGGDPPAAAYDIRVGSQPAAHVRVWSGGGYVGLADEPMTHVGFQIENKSSTVIRFDSDALELKLLDNRGRSLPRPAFTSVVPLGPALVSIWPGTTVTLDGYFRLFVRPQVVARMTVQWTLVIGQRKQTKQTSFVRDDDSPILDYRPDDSTAPGS